MDPINQKVLFFILKLLQVGYKVGGRHSRTGCLQQCYCRSRGPGSEASSHQVQAFGKLLILNEEGRLQEVLSFKRDELIVPGWFRENSLDDVDVLPLELDDLTTTYDSKFGSLLCDLNECLSRT